ncbi:Uncharacterized protein TCM_032482 [Theobroma cacao]|uniref:Uncharacterized protein n=1 Tax=Theobroma cacao TaxID=3641 RepID=A0A061FAT6_THECC|nr:Uncharacterized protein TCM_032482 [Theobroma cacao]
MVSEQVQLSSIQISSITTIVIKDCVFRFLNKLNSSYATLRSQLLLFKTFPTLNKAYNLVLRDESQRSLLMQSQPLIEAFAIVAVSDNKKKATGNLVCGHCGKKCHTKDKCYMLVGFLENFKFSKSKGNFRKNVVAVNNVVINALEDQDDENVAGPVSQISLTKGQFQTLMAMIIAHEGQASENEPPTFSQHNNKPFFVNFTLIASLSQNDAVSKASEPPNPTSSKRRRFTPTCPRGSAPADSFHSQSNPSTSHISPRRSTRLKKPPKYLESYRCPSLNSLVTVYPIHHYLFANQLSFSHKAFTIALNHISKPFFLTSYLV